MAYRRDSDVACSSCGVFNGSMHLRPILSAVRLRVIRSLRRLDESIMPLRCAFCGTRSSSGERRVCGACHADLPWIANACARCAQPVPAVLPQGVFCAACQKHPPPLHATVAPLRYAFPVDAGLKALKFGRRLYYAPAFAELLCREMQWLAGDVDAILPVPLHWRRQAFRGFNQATEICKPLARRFSVPVISGVIRSRATPFQSGLAATERHRNLRRAFVVRKPLRSQHVLIVDDVVTTGATTCQLAKVLLEGGVERVSVLAVARAT